jgi:hypothetical protein
MRNGMPLATLYMVVVADREGGDDRWRQQSEGNALVEHRATLSVAGWSVDDGVIVYVTLSDAPSCPTPPNPCNRKPTLGLMHSPRDRFSCWRGRHPDSGIGSSGLR